MPRRKLASSKKSNSVSKKAKTEEKPKEMPKYMAANSVCHVEFAANDLDRVQKFYGDVFDWKFEPWEKEYIGFKSAGDNKEVLMGGFKLTKETIATNGGTMIYLLVDDLEKYSKKITDAGGKILDPNLPCGPDAAGVVFLDSEGSKLALYAKKEKKEEKKEEPEPEFEIKSNPARVTPVQVKFLAFQEEERYSPIKKGGDAFGIIMLKDKTPDAEETFVSPATSGTGSKDEEKEPDPPESFEYDPSKG